jgi:pyruvate kinase
VDLIADSINQTVNALRPTALVVPTHSGAMARNVARFRLPTWITAFSTDENTCQRLQFSYGVYPVRVEREQTDWTPFTRQWLSSKGVNSGLVVLTQGPSPENPAASHRMEIVDLAKQP